MGLLLKNIFTKTFSPLRRWRACSPSGRVASKSFCEKFLRTYPFLCSPKVLHFYFERTLVFSKSYVFFVDVQMLPLLKAWERFLVSVPEHSWEAQSEVKIGELQNLADSSNASSNTQIFCTPTKLAETNWRMLEWKWVPLESCLLFLSFLLQSFFWKESL